MGNAKQLAKEFGYVEKEEEVDNNSKKIFEFFDKKNLAKQFIDHQPIYFDNSKMWWVWNIKMNKWELKDETDLLNNVSDISTADTIKSKEKQEILEAFKQVSRRHAPAEIKKSWVQFDDMIFDFETGMSAPASSDYFITNPIPWKLTKEKDIKTPNMDRIFEEWVGKESVQTLYEILAYCLIPDYPIHRIFCFIGAGMNGKSCFLNLLRKFVGSSNCCSTELDTLLTSRFEVTRLHKKLVCQMGETNFNEMDKTSTLKKLSGGDLIGFEYKNKDPFEDINYAKIMISTNNLPSTNDKTIGFYRRWMIVDFPNQFDEKKDILSEIPDEEYEHLAAKCCSILKDLLKKREFTNEGSIDDRMQRYEDRSNPIQKFISEFCDSDDADHFTTKSMFETKLNLYLKDNKLRSMTDVAISRYMKKHSYNDGRARIKWFEDDGKITHRQARVWYGIKLKDQLK
jgi:putative DNA primase/helicase